ncbi:ABC transporter substrate-binding protein [Pseudonocardia xishanensis]|uniref:ABC transporter substrate-binding protein n=1 Tax=Pseudonocardia xishanensis TaxID=630995 RepID=A0ABP8RD62_9PSEU
MRSRIVSLAAASLAALIALAGCSSGATATSPDPATPLAVDLRLDWTWGAQHLGYLAADRLGYFAEEGLTTTITEGEGSAVTGTVVGTGQAQFGVMAAGEVLAASSKGLDVQAVYTVLQSSPTAIVYDADKFTVSTPADLYGHKLGVAPQSTTFKEYEALGQLTGLDRGRITEVSVGAQIVPALMSGDVDAVIAFSNNQFPQLQLQGKNVGYLNFTDAGMPDTPSAAVVVNKDFAADNPEAVGAFVRAVDRGWTWVAENQAEALRMLGEARPEVNPEFAAKVLPLFLEGMGPVPGFGRFDASRWAALEKLYADQGLLGSAVTLDGGVYDGKYLA